MRSILCPDCAKNFTMHPSDAAEGWHMRKVEIKARVPTDGSHRITVMAGGDVVSDTPVPIICCDHGNEEIPEGSIGVCVTMWRDPDPEPGNWELAYSQPESHGQTGHDTAEQTDA